MTSTDLKLLEEHHQENPVIVKSELTETHDTILLNLIVKLYHTITNSIDDPRLSRVFVKSLLTIASSDHGLSILLHLHEYKAYTHLELRKKYGIKRQTAHQIKQNLEDLDIKNPEPITIKSKPDPSRMGKRLTKNV